jgi:hypothetical protein
MGSSLDNLLRDGRLELLSIDERRLLSDCVDEFLAPILFRSMVPGEGGEEENVESRWSTSDC